MCCQLVRSKAAQAVRGAARHHWTVPVNWCAQARQRLFVLWATAPYQTRRQLKVPETATVNQSWKSFPRYHHSGPRGAQYGNASLLFTVERRERANLRKFLHSALWGATVTVVSAEEV